MSHLGAYETGYQRLRSDGWVTRDSVRSSLIMQCELVNDRAVDTLLFSLEVNGVIVRAPFFDLYRVVVSPRLFHDECTRLMAQLTNAMLVS